jgi:halimadienyl-diphosphate synthase
MGPSPYDIAWLARLRYSGDGLRWPKLTDWLLAHQHQDGSWGGSVVYCHERIIATLTAAIALAETAEGPAVCEALRRAERYIWQHLHLLRHDPWELVGFELIMPTLLAEARALGLDMPSHACGYEDIQTSKLRLIPPDMLYSSHVTTVHSLEFLGHAGDPLLLSQAVNGNGSLGNSPATTAYYLLRRPDDERAWAYLDRMQSTMGHPVYLYPFAMFELAWVLNNFAFCETPITAFADHRLWEQLYGHITPSGIGLDPSFGIPDGDTTSVACRLLIEAGYDVAPTILASFEDAATRTFRTYDYERNVSVGTNVHALEALDLMPGYPDREQVRDQVLLMVLDGCQFNVYWTDKWHTSPYYATSHVLVALLRHGTFLIRTIQPAVDWLIHAQRADGSWGFFETGTAEETAYALIALLHYRRHAHVNPDILQRGAAYLAHAYDQIDPPFPELWIGKCLFLPQDVVRSAILAGLILYEEAFGRSP